MTTEGAPCDMVTSYPSNEITHEESLIKLADMPGDIFEIWENTMSARKLTKVESYTLIIDTKRLELEAQCHKSIRDHPYANIDSWDISLNFMAKLTPTS